MNLSTLMRFETNLFFFLSDKSWTPFSFFKKLITKSLSNPYLGGIGTFEVLIG